MSTILKANNTETPCEAAEHYRDSAWGRPTCTVTIKASAAEVAALLPSNAPWSLIEREDVLDELGAPTGQTVDHERDMSEYSLSGDTETEGSASRWASQRRRRPPSVR